MISEDVCKAIDKLTESEVDELQAFVDDAWAHGLLRGLWTGALLGVLIGLIVPYAWRTAVFIWEAL